VSVLLTHLLVIAGRMARYASCWCTSCLL